MTETVRRFDEARRLLVLSALSYRSFSSGLTPRLQSERLHGAIERGLGNLAGIAGGWELVWGPIAYRAPLSLVDDSVMFVVRSTIDPHDYVIVVRGTNPGSPFDWLFGDVWVGVQAPWTANAAAQALGATTSFSTLLGLNLLQVMQAPPPPSGLVGTLANLVIGRINEAGDQLRAWLRPLAADVATQVTALRTELLPLVAQLDAVRRSYAIDDPTARVRALLDTWRSPLRRRVLRDLGEAVAVVNHRHAFNALHFLTGGEQLRQSLVPGVTLIAFLQAAVAAADGARVRVTTTGHSKGGALAPTLALWLADSQGAAVSDETLAWDPHRQATVRSVAFAGPTAGNAAFARHSDAVIGAECHRVVNPLDIVPLAWEPATLRSIPSLYRGAAPTRLVDDLVAEIALDADRFGYTHLGSHVSQIATHEDPLHGEFFVQAGHQHMTAYLEAFDLGNAFADVVSYFSPLA